MAKFTFREVMRMGLSILLCIFIVIFAVLTFNYELIGLLAIELIAIAFVPLNLCLHWRLFIYLQV